MDQQRLRRVFDVVGYLARSGGATISEVNRDLDMPLSSAHDLLRALVNIDAVSIDGKRYRIGPRSVRMAFDTLDTMAVPRISEPHLEKLAQCSGIDAYLAMRTGTKVVYVSRHAGNQPVNIDIPLGRPLYLHSTAVGKLFAALDRDMCGALATAAKPALTQRTRTTMDKLMRDFEGIRIRELSISRGESVAGILGIAAPIRDSDGRLVAAAHLSMLQGSVNATRVRELGRMVKETSQAIECQLASRHGGIGWTYSGTA